MELTMGLLMGFAYMASPGPITSETLRRGTIFGFPAAISFQLGGMIGHLLYALLAYSGVQVLLKMGQMQLILGIFSACLLLYLGISSIKDRNLFLKEVDEGGKPGCSIINTFFAGGLISITNPFAIAFWLSLSSQAKNIPVDSEIFLAGFFISLTAVAGIIVILASYLMKRIDMKWSKLIISGCGLVLIGFGIKVGYSILMAV